MRVVSLLMGLMAFALVGCEEYLLQPDQVARGAPMDKASYDSMMSNSRSLALSGNYSLAAMTMPVASEDKSSDTLARILYENGLFNAAADEMENAKESFELCSLRKYTQRYLDACKQLATMSASELDSTLTDVAVDRELRRLMSASDTSTLAPMPIRRSGGSGAVGGLSPNDECFSAELTQLCAANMGGVCKTMDRNAQNLVGRIYQVRGGSILDEPIPEINVVDAARAASCEQAIGVHLNRVCANEYESLGFPQCARCARLQAEELLATSTAGRDIIRRLSSSPNPSEAQMANACNFNMP